MNHTPSTTAFDVTLADGGRERINAEKVFVADASLTFSVAGHPTHIFGDGIAGIRHTKTSDTDCSDWAACRG